MVLIHSGILEELLYLLYTYKPLFMSLEHLPCSHPPPALWQQQPSSMPTPTSYTTFSPVENFPHPTAVQRNMPPIACILIGDRRQCAFCLACLRIASFSSWLYGGDREGTCLTTSNVLVVCARDREDINVIILWKMEGDMCENGVGGTEEKQLVTDFGGFGTELFSLPHL